VLPGSIDEQLWARVTERVLDRPTVAVLATGSRDGEVATTLISWLTALPDAVLAIAIDRRGTSFENLAVNPAAAVEIFDRKGGLGLRGVAELIDDEIASAPFPCSPLLLYVHEIRNHCLASVELDPVRYRYVPSREHYAERELEILAELERLPVRTR
jgi:hypothetical protein